ncbi:MAG: acyl-CoA dehydrogenase [Burkholderiaceae bacterium]
MDFQFSEEQQLLADTVKRLVDRDYDFEARKKILHSDAGYSTQAWGALGEMGIFGLALGEAAGGFGMGVMGMVPIMEQIGHGLLLEPVVATLVGAKMIELLDAEGQAALLGELAQGRCRLAVAVQEPGADIGAASVSMTAAKSGDGWRLSGEKTMVVHAPMAERLLVCARVSGKAGESDGLAVFLVDADATGLKQRTMRTVDGYRAADLVFDDVPASAVGEPGAAHAAVEAALDFGNLLTCAEGVGAMDSANAATLEYIKNRKQFGVPIGAFQALQHRMVDMTVSAQQARSMLYKACDAFDRATAGEIDARARMHMVSAAKIKIADAARQVGQDAIQLHGGMGMTDEMKVSHTFKRLTMISQQFGDIDHHLARFAATEG